MLYVFYGDDSFSMLEALQRLRAELDTDGSLETNTVRIDAQQSSPPEIMGTCDTVPFLGARRLVIVEGLLSQGGKAKRGRKAKEATPDDDGLHPLAEYVPRMPESTVLVLLGGKETSDGDGSLVAQFRPHGTVTKFSKPNQKAVVGWVSRRAREIGLKLDAAAANLVADRIGNDTWMLASELDKLAAYVGGEAVRREDADLLVTDVREQQGYLLADAIAERKPATALRLLEKMLGQGQPAPVLLATVQGRYRRLAIAREMLDDGATTVEIGRRVGSTGYALQRLLEQASGTPMTTIRAAYDRLIEAERDVKQGHLDYDLSLQLLVHDLATMRAARGDQGLASGDRRAGIGSRA